VVVDDQLRTALEDVGQREGPAGPVQHVLRELDHGKAAALGGDGVEFPGGRLLPDPELGEGGFPRGLVDDRWQGVLRHAV